jgi:hypothetical protein
MKDIILGLIRHTVTTMGGVLVTSGYVDESGVQTLAGAAAVIVGAGLSVLDKKIKANK